MKYITVNSQTKGLKGKFILRGPFVEQVPRYYKKSVLLNQEQDAGITIKFVWKIISTRLCCLS